jgi:O-antigen ligase
MPENIRALVAILVLATVIFTLAKAPARAMFSVSGDFERRRNLWFAITLAAFLAFNYWVFMLLAAILLRRAALKEGDKVALVLFVLLAIPLIPVEIPGFAGVRYLFKIDYFILIALVILAPAFFEKIKKHSMKYFWTEKTDKFLYVYLILNGILNVVLLDNNFTGVLRVFFMTFATVALPYAIASRLTKGTTQLRAAFSAYVIGASIMAAVGVFEAARSWLLYTSLERSLGIDWSMTIYLKRGEALRAIATAGQAIAFGYTMAVGFMLMLGLGRFFQKKVFWWSGLALLIFGMLASYSRGPWLGAIVGFLVFVIASPDRWKNLGLLILASVVIGTALSATPLGDRFYGAAVTVDTGSYDYRQLVLDESIKVILRNPFFGVLGTNYLPDLEELRQGQGIIDIVNSYVTVAMRSGLVGLTLFLGIFVSAMVGILQRMNAISDKHSEEFDQGRVLLATLICILVSIYTVSSITFIPIIYYMVVGLSVAYAKSGREQPSPDSVGDPGSISHSRDKLKRGRFQHSSKGFKRGKYASD